MGVGGGVIWQVNHIGMNSRKIITSHYICYHDISAKNNLLSCLALELSEIVMDGAHIQQIN